MRSETSRARFTQSTAGEEGSTDLLTSNRKTEYFTGALLLGGGVLIAYLCFRIFRPFFAPMVWATVLALLLHPLYDPAARALRNRSGTAALLCLLGVLVLGVPFFYLISSLPGEIKEGYEEIDAALRPGAGGESADPRLVNAWNRLVETAARAGYHLPSVISDLVRGAGDRLIAAAPRLVGGAAEYLFDFVLTFLTLFFFLRDGDRLVHWLRDLVPLGQEQTSGLFTKIRDVVRATVLGGLAVAVAQGSIGGALFWALGVPTPLLWGVLMGTLSLIPPLGAWLIWIPAGALLIWQGALWKGILLLAGGALGIGLIDNILRPLIIGQRTRLPTLLIFFSLLGGLQVFGPVGLIVGPVLVALLVGILEFTREQVQRQAKSI